MLFMNQFINVLGICQACKAYGKVKDYIEKAGSVQDCIFPFIHNSKIYYGCAASEDGKGHFCATKVDSNSNLINRAICNKCCKHDKDRKFHISY